MDLHTFDRCNSSIVSPPIATKPVPSMFSIKLRITNVTDGTITVLREWGEKLNYELRYWKVKCEGWSNLNADRDKTQYYIDLTVKFRRKE